ncbi:helix-turn-helix domain-containing protein [Verminephrobacter aporrectodeae subsp. tuberculatae]|uniref:helix-turn-helix domain-containing protein n=1 Tax=Verminephrobacter aporrectodeae TaxID=1110389 RepID=UPI002237C18B|nr:helix-turn-helix domain-containing protein [Verminephrobacter aporrectodeae]MCW5257225.1 helix-turn-helix domain-containing protein [Verminephrobacter aporrectodeae subsp. tuberculatae]
MRGPKCKLTVSAEDQLALKRLSRSSNRQEADRARAILWSLEGQTGVMIGAAIGMHADGVRRLRHLFSLGGVDALRARPRTGRPATRGETVLACARVILCEPGQPRWTLPLLGAEIERRCGVRISMAWLSTLLRKASLGVVPEARAPGAKANKRPNTRVGG